MKKAKKASEFSKNVCHVLTSLRESKRLALDLWIAGLPDEELLKRGRDIAVKAIIVAETNLSLIKNHAMVIAKTEAGIEKMRATGRD